MPVTHRQRLQQLRWQPFAAALAVGLALGFAGPFGSNPAYPTVTRYAFWLGLTAAGAVAAVAAGALLPPGWPRTRALRIAAVALLSAIPMTFVVAWTITFLRPGRVFAPHQLPSLFAAVAVIQLLIAYVLAITTPSAVGRAAPEQTAPAKFPAALLRKLPPAIGTDVIALETEDHYLRIRTPAGSALVLMRMSDAVAMIDSRLGMQVHRRWWVAYGAVDAMSSVNQRLIVRLVDGTQVPVGRTFAAAARARFGNPQAMQD
ncbi:LytTR family transcriptional regulator [Sphingomonas sabuli]|uniref:LytTR family transcriptional regulator n=1 Tax=Sphingomonas sabuli TaxID=2764186 RepID=A0A7G9L5G1_9SPHN|nr:LytTR family DNA-binding domain-containing protein [Sphingomonas sabuli]QNM83860.1 LytTR family transcriptional regulator [Sphingomonas sabuli]